MTDLGRHSIFTSPIEFMTSATWKNDSPRNLREVSGLARLSVSSYKEEHPPQKLTDGNPDTYWQSDGPQPHFINLEFSQKMTLTKLSIYVDHGRDESYTPREIAVRAGNSFYDLQDVQRFEIGEDTGWVDFVLCEDEDTTRPLRAFLVQICILENYQHGKDTHVRGLKIWAPSLRLDMMVPEMPPFSTLEYQMYSTIR
ncbi:anaphase-promoting complex, subunit 10/DOC domain-containing protein [Powellomyces hirtus]|nr:anaphase-promoting complex, subunit 10/DOC domain-containing protein [Powellomyces hirtus]